MLTICSWILVWPTKEKKLKRLLVPLIIVPLSLFMCCWCLFFTSVQHWPLWIGQTVFGAYFHGFGWPFWNSWISSFHRISVGGEIQCPAPRQLLHPTWGGTKLFYPSFICSFLSFILWIKITSNKETTTLLLPVAHQSYSKVKFHLSWKWEVPVPCRMNNKTCSQ